MVRSFVTYRQPNQMDCGPTCLRMVAKYYGKHYSVETLRQLSRFGKDGVSMLGISGAAEQIGFRTTGAKLTPQQLLEQTTLPAIVHWRQHHFVVVAPRSGWQKWRGIVAVADPAKGMLLLKEKEFLQQWQYKPAAIEGRNETQHGIALLLEPTPNFYASTSEPLPSAGWGRLMQYVWGQKMLLLHVGIALLVGSILQLIFPLLTQSMVDSGINAANLSFIQIALLAQLVLTAGRTMVELVRSRLLLYISNRINIQLLSDFWIKLLRLPISFFDAKMTGDIMQRLGDHQRLQSFLTGSLLSSLFSIVNLLIYGAILLLYDWRLFGIYTFGTLLYYGWIRIFLPARRRLDVMRFGRASRENMLTMQLVQGMQDIKLNGAERLRRWEWEGTQAALFKLQFQSMSINQWQQAGAMLLNESKNIMLTLIVAQAVVAGSLTLGAMLAVQYIIGSLNGPIEQLIGFVQQAQDARLSLDRINEIHSLPDEEVAASAIAPIKNFRGSESMGDKELKPAVSKNYTTSHLPAERDISISNLTFTYAGAGNMPVLQGVTMHIPAGKITAIVGMSGSGKTTLLKLLLKFYDQYDGSIHIGTIASSTPGLQLRYISAAAWRRHCGAVLQDGYIYSDTIARNIAPAEEWPDIDMLLHAAAMANILAFIEGLPMGFHTIIGAEGNGISQGQKQRLLIARAIYKNPDYLFFDEATNSLDANNERIIMDNLNKVFKGKTAVVVAHRLSTVTHAHHIVVLHQGSVVEQGTHQELTMLRGHYYTLVKNQLELGS